jgi:hypothetical protein
MSAGWVGSHVLLLLLMLLLPSTTPMLQSFEDSASTTGL